MRRFGGPSGPPPANSGERAEEARQRRERSLMLASGELPADLEEKIAEMVRDQASKETARILDELRNDVPAQILKELEKKVEEGLDRLDDDDDDEEDAIQ